MWRRRRKQNVGLSKKCDRWAMKFYMAGTAPTAKEGGRIHGEGGSESEGKKTFYWYTRVGKVQIVEQIFTQGRRGPEIRPFSKSAQVECRGCSEGLQQAITDFGADEPFMGAAAKLREHYGIEIPVSTVRTVTEQHGAAMLVRHQQCREWALVNKVVFALMSGLPFKT